MKFTGNDEMRVTNYSLKFYAEILRLTLGDEKAHKLAKQTFSIKAFDAFAHSFSGKAKLDMCLPTPASKM